MVTDGLQLYYDVNNIKSYPGEPTTNIVTYPDWSNISDHVVGTASRTKESYLDIGDGITIVQATTSDIISVTVSVNDSTPTSGVEQTWSADLYCTSTGSKIKSQIIVYVDGVKNWLQNDGSWTTSVNEYGYMFSPTSANQWHRWSKTITLPVGTLTGLAFGSFYRTTGNFTLKIANVQIEEKSHATQFLWGTRSTTDGLKDLSGNSNHNNLNNVSFDSNARPTFTVSTDSILIDELALGDATNWTVCMWIKATQDGYLLSNASSGPVVNAMGILSNKIMYRHYSGTWLYDYGTSTVNDGTWHFVSWVNHSDETMDMYVDAIVEKEGFSSTMAGSTGPCDILGNYWSSNKPIGGPIDVVMIYPATALTSSQILQNYNALKGRYI